MNKLFLFRSLTMLTLLTFATLFSFAQNKVTGKVTDDAGKPVEGATVQVKGSTIATTTKADGSFEIDAPSKTSTLVISHVGFVAIEQPIREQATLSISMAQSANSLEDV